MIGGRTPASSGCSLAADGIGTRRPAVSPRAAAASSVPAARRPASASPQEAHVTAGSTTGRAPEARHPTSRSAEPQAGAYDPSGASIVNIDDYRHYEVAEGVIFCPVFGRNLSLNFVVFPPHSGFPTHTHPEEQISIVREGTMEITVGDITKMVVPGRRDRVPLRRAPLRPHRRRGLQPHRHLLPAARGPARGDRRGQPGPFRRCRTLVEVGHGVGLQPPSGAHPRARAEGSRSDISRRRTAP